MALARLPPLREELALYAGAPLATGEPSHVLEDPVRNQFFQIDWMTYEFLCRWSLAEPGDVLLSMRAGTTLHVDEDDLQAVLRFLHENQLLRPDPLASSTALAGQRRRAHGSLATRLLHNYLFFRVPLVRPDRWLERAAPAFGWLFTATFARLTGIAALFGAFAMVRDWDRVNAAFLDTLTPGGITGYAIALVFVKCAHELGHAVTAKRYGCRVPTMGVAFLVLWPVPYTDTNAVWRLASRAQRQRVAAAGVLTELAIAVWATVAWTLLPDGLLRAVMFPLATTTWIATLAINSSPFMRFDGYFLLSDFMNIPNLHARAFAMARWQLRETLFRLGAPAPELFAPARRRALVVFAWMTWIYRLALFLGIAVLVYHFFIKAVGILLFGVEIMWFVIRPVASEIALWRTLWPALKQSRRARISGAIGLLLVLLLAVPLPTRLHAGAMLRPAAVFPVHAHGAAQIARLPLLDGARVEQGSALIELLPAEAASRRIALSARVERLRWQASTAAFDGEQRRQRGVLLEELDAAEKELKAIEQEAAYFAPTAPFAGTLRDLGPELAPGVWVRKNERLALLVADGAYRVDSYLSEDDVHRIKVGDTARFQSDGLGGPVLRLKVLAIDRDASRTLPSGAWAVPQGGSVAAREKDGLWYAEHGVYHVTFGVDGDVGELARQEWRGTVSVDGRWEAPGARFVRAFFAVFWREAGF